MSYDECLSEFKYETKTGPETIKIMKDYGTHDDYSRQVDEITLEKFDYCCSSAGKESHNQTQINKLKYEKILQDSKEKDLVKKDKFSQELEGLVNNEEFTEVADKELEELKGLEKIEIN